MPKGTRRGFVALFAGLLPLLALPASAQGRQQQLDPTDLRFQEVMKLQDAYTPMLMQNTDIIGTATGLNEAGEVAIQIFVNQESETSQRTARSLDAAIGGDVPLQVLFTTPFVAKKGGPPGGSGVDHKAIQNAPIQLGTSGGWRYDLANGFCCGGTLGALIQVGGNKRILSNYHVFEADIVAGGNGLIATTGDPIIQPGLIDIGCNANNSQTVATLVRTSALPGSNVDASSANIVSGMVDPNGAILEIGELSANTTGAFVGQAVKKSGRTTGLTRSDVNSLNATISVSYENECAGGSAFTKTFTGQIVINNRRSKFLAGGDSGSLMVEDVSTNPRAVGLLFAGSNSYAIANPINDVLSFFGASMVGN